MRLMGVIGGLIYLLVGSAVLLIGISTMIGGAYLYGVVWVVLGWWATKTGRRWAFGSPWSATGASAAPAYYRAEGPGTTDEGCGAGHAGYSDKAQNGGGGC